MQNQRFFLEYLHKSLDKETRSAPQGTALLVSALMIYPAFTAVNVDLDHKTMRFDFQFFLERIPEKDEAHLGLELIAGLKRKLKFMQYVLGFKPTISEFKSKTQGSLFSASWERDLATLGEDEVDIIHGLIFDFYEEHEVDFEDMIIDIDQFDQYEQVFDYSFHELDEMDPSTRLRAYRDMGVIYIHKIDALYSRESQV